MDVVLRPTSGKPSTWILEDRLGRPVGKVAQSGKTFRIEPLSDPSLEKIKRVHDSLDAAMSEIAKHYRGACELEEAP